MADIMDKQLPKDAQVIIRGIAKMGFITLGPHCRKRMAKRNFDFQDLEYLPCRCIVTDPPEYDKDHDDWKYQAKGTVIDGDKATAITVIVSHNELFCVTIIDK